MKKVKLFIGIAVVSLLAIGLVFVLAKDKEPEFKTIDPEFVSYISSFTSGIISSESTIKVRLAQEYASAEEGTEVDTDVFSFSPSINGQAIWVDNRTIEFIPAEKLPSGVFYDAQFDLSELMDVPDKFSLFEFNFQVIKQNIEVSFEQIKTYEKTQLEWQIVEGSVITADVISLEDLSKIFSANISDKKYDLKFENGSRSKVYNYRIDSVPRIDKGTELIIQWNGEDLNIDQSGEIEIEIPALGDFKVLQTKIYQQPKQYVSIVFSDPLDENQDLRGLVSIKNYNSKITVEGNEIKIYPSGRLAGKQIVNIFKGISNISGYKTDQEFEIEVTFEDIKPKIELLGNGVIFPTADGIKFPFRAVNLKAVKVKIIKVYETNIAQFLQVNQFDGEREIKRVGRIVYKNTHDLTTQKSIDYGKWNTFALQLDQLIETEPGAIYRVMLSFGMKHSLYPCADADANSMEDMDTDENWDEDNSNHYGYWGEYDDYDYYYYDDYDYSQRDNPCNKAFYRGSKTSVSRNVLASDFGIIAKAGGNKKMSVAVTDLTTTAPVSGVKLEILNYQQQTINTAKTNGKGLVEFDINKKPYLLVAKKGKQRGYLRLDNGSSLSTSKFNVSGAVIQKGIKGFIYGERGVWRPGDTLFLNFILEDKDELLPQNHPVKFELLNPDGQIIKTITKNTAVGKFYNFTTKTDQEAVTGNWMARVKVGGAIFTKKIRIETIKPNRLKIDLDFGRERLSVQNSDIAGKLTVKWLHGAVARSLKTDIKVTTKQTRTSFDKYNNYTFDDPSRSFDSEEQVLFNGKLNEEGIADIKAKINVKDAAPGMLNASFLIKVFEEGGEFSVDRFTIPYAPYKSFAGILVPKGDKRRGMLLTDKKHKIDIVTLDADGNLVDSRVKIEVFKVQWRYWWQRTSNDELSRYLGNNYRKPISTSYENTTNGLATGTIKIAHPDWGRFFVRVTDVNSGHSTGKTVYIDWPGWASRASSNNPGGASMLIFNTDKDDYTVGEEVKVSFPSSDKGKALVSIESGSKVVETYWVETTAETTNFSFKATAEMAPNVFINVTLIQPHNLKDNDLPIRLYGIQPINVEDPETRLTPVIEMAKELHPEEEVNIEISETDGKAMEYTIAMVDEGLLDITRFKTPNPWKTFYAKEALGVRTWDMYKYVMGAYAGEISGLLQIGGDDLMNKKGGDKANRFKPVVKFLGPFTLKKGKTNTHSFIMPQYVGSVRTMVIASKKKAYGFAEETTPVKQPLMVLATLPRVVGPTEEVKLPVTVFAMDKNIKNVTIDIESNELFTVKGKSKKTITFNKTGDQIVNFDLIANKKIGIAKVAIVAKSGKNKASYNIELDVRNPNPPTVSVIDKVIEAGQTWNSNFDLVGIEGTNKAFLEISNIPSINLEKRLKYLLRYPHGCVEQTTSAAFPQLFLADVMDLLPSEKAKVKENIQAALNKLLNFQHSSGGFVYWPGYNYTNDWGSSYVGHFLIEAKNKGYMIPSGMITKWVKYQKSAANSWKTPVRNSPYYYHRSDMMQAYRLYTLALAQKAEIGAMNRLKEKTNLSLQAKWRLAAAYALAGQKEVAKNLIFELEYQIADYREMSYSYGSSHRDKAMILESMILMGEKEKAALVLKQIAQQLSTERWMSTQSTAYALIAASKYIGDNKIEDDMTFAYQLNDQDKRKLTSTLPISKQDLAELKAKNSLKFENKTEGILFARIISEGIPVVGDTKDEENDLKMTVKYYDLENRPIDPSMISQGTDFKVEVSLFNPGYRGVYKEMALTQIFPSGWEIHNIRMDEVGSVHSKSTADYMDVRDDRIYYYFNLNKGETKTFVSLLNASYLGKFYLPTVYSEAMYDNTINARKAGQWVEVVK